MPSAIGHYRAPCIAMAVAAVMAAVRVGVAAMVAVVRRMVAVAATLVVAAMIVPAAPAVAAVVDRGIAHRLVIAGIAVAQPAGVSGAHAALVELDAIVVAPAAARAIALPAFGGGDISIVDPGYRGPG